MDLKDNMSELGLITKSCGNFSFDVDQECVFKKCCKKYKKSEKKRCKKCPKR